MDEAIISSISGLIPFLIGGGITAIAWLVKSHFGNQRRDDNLETRLETLEKWRTDHDKDTGSISNELHEFRLDMADKISELRVDVKECQTLIKKNGHLTNE